MERTDVTIVPELAEKMGYRERVAGALRHSGMSVLAIAEATGIPANNVRVTLLRHRDLFAPDQSVHPPIWFILAPAGEPEPPNEPF